MHIAIAGNIGSGKTTLASLLARHLGFEAQYEDPSVNPYIQDFYTDMNRWAFNLQIYFLQSRLAQATAIQRSGADVIQDRTLYEDAEIFAPNLLTMGLMSQRDFDTYLALYNSVVPLVKPPDLVIFLRGSVATLVDQIASRGREYEENIRIDYLKKLNERYTEWFDRYDLGKKMVIDLEQLNFRDRPEDLGKIVARINAERHGLFS